MAQSGYSEDFRCKNGNTVHIVIADDGYVAQVFMPDKLSEIGRLEFLEYDEGTLLLVWANLDQLNRSYLRQGIGRRCVQLVADRFDMPLVARPHDGAKLDDGSHLTGDAPAFVDAMRNEGLITYLGEYRGEEMREEF